jgi:hypothetical protein
MGTPINGTFGMLENSNKGEYDFDVMVLEPPIEVGFQLHESISLYIIENNTYPTTYGTEITCKSFNKFFKINKIH